MNVYYSLNDEQYLKQQKRKLIKLLFKQRNDTIKVYCHETKSYITGKVFQPSYKEKYSEVNTMKIGFKKSYGEEEVLYEGIFNMQKLRWETNYHN